jgi:hypothetical protein
MEIADNPGAALLDFAEVSFAADAAERVVSLRLSNSSEFPARVLPSFDYYGRS